jgi:hypothetical protein
VAKRWCSHFILLSAAVVGIAGQARAQEVRSVRLQPDHHDVRSVQLQPDHHGSQTTPRRQFVTVSYDWLYTWPLHFDKFPLEDIVGMPLDETDPPYDYRSEDGRTLVDVEQFRRRNRAVSVAVYPFGLSTGATLGIRGSIEQLPDIRVRFDGASPIASYSLTKAVAYDIGAGIYVADRSAGWGLGAYSFLIGGIGRVTSDERSGRRYFAEGGGGLQSGPFGFELSVKFGWNRFTEPVEHRFLTVPINMRATVSF